MQHAPTLVCAIAVLGLAIGTAKPADPPSLPIAAITALGTVLAVQWAEERLPRITAAPACVDR